MLPADPIILLSYINTQLRDHYASLDALCADQDADKDAICAKLADVGYEYNASRKPVCVTVLITPTCFRIGTLPRKVRCCFWVNRSAVCCARHA